MFEWREPLMDYVANLGRDLKLKDSMGVALNYEEALRLIPGLWCAAGSAAHAGHDGDIAASHAIRDDEAVILNVVDTPEGPQVTADRQVFGGKTFLGKPMKMDGIFGMEVDMGEFPAFPSFAYVTRVGAGRGVLYMTWSMGGKWFKE